MARLPAFAIDDAMVTGRTLRTVAYMGTSGQTGVGTPESMKVTANGASVSIAPGAAVAATRYVSSPSYNSYVLVSDSVASVSIPATGSGNGAVRYIIARADDPEFGGQGDPSEIFWHYEQVASITNLPFPFVPLARINQPASTTSITNAMITDLRTIATPRRVRDTADFVVTSAMNLTSAEYVDFPPGATAQLAVPTWATRAVVRADLLEAMTQTGHTDGQMVLMLGNQPAYSGARRFDEVWGGATARTDHTVVANFNITPAMRGTTQPLRIRARKMGGAGHLRADTYTQVVYDYEFIEAPA